MTAPIEFGPYSSATYFFDSVYPHVVSTEDLDRLRAYDVHEKMYWNEPGWSKLVKRGDDDASETEDVYIPSTRRIIEAVNRFLGLDFGVSMDPDKGTPDEQEQLKVSIEQLFAREKFRALFNDAKRMTLVRGEAVIHVTADDRKLPGERISVHEVDPHGYFPIRDPDRPKRVVGCHLVEIIDDPADPKKSIVRRQTYRKRFEEIDGEPVGPLVAVTTELGYFELAKWDDRDPANEVTPYRHPDLDPRPEADLELNGKKILAVPVYVLPNTGMGEFPFGVSECRGVERAIAAVNQSLSDEDLTLIMQGLGVYWTNAGPPVDENDNATELTIAPGVILEVPDGNTIGRLNGVSSVAPFMEHMKFIIDQVDGGLGISNVATGNVDATVAESGVALALQMDPLLKGNEEKELHLKGTLNQFLYDLCKYWLPAFEGTSDACVALATFGDAKPRNRKAEIEETITLHDANLILTEMAVARLAELGWEFPENAAAQLLEQTAARTTAATPVDPFAERVASETGASNDPSEGDGA